MPRIVLTTSTGESDTVSGWSRRTGITTKTIKSRLERGASVDETLFGDFAKAGSRPHGTKPHSPGGGWAKRTTGAETELENSLGETDTAANWSRRTGIGLATIHSRLRRGWSVDEALGTPPPFAMHEVEWKGRNVTIDQLAREAGIRKATMVRRLQEGWSIDEAVAFRRNSQARRRVGTIEWKGNSYTIPSLAKQYGMSSSTLHNRLRRGWVLEEALTAPPRKRKQ